MIFDVAVIGGGPGGYTAALEAVRCGLSAVLFEKDRLGGTCLNAGCVPTKYLAHVSELNRIALGAGEYGLALQNAGLDFARTQQKNAGIIGQLRDGLYQRLAQSGVELVFGEASLAGKDRVRCGGTLYEARNIILATGSRAVRHSENMLVSEEALALQKLPASLAIVGGGVSAVEFAQIFSGLGSRVSLYIRGERILRKWDRDIAVGLTRNLKKRGVKIHTGCDAAALSAVRDEAVLSVTGRRPGLVRQSVPLYAQGADGGILVDGACQTQTPGVYAVGDCTSGSPMLAHIAMDQARRAVFHIKHGKARPAGPVAACIYTTPEAACVGLTERQAQQQGKDAVCVRQTLYANARTLIEGGERGFIKLVAEKGSRRVLGAQFLCGRASDIVNEVSGAIAGGLTVEDMLKIARPHPSFAEALTDALTAAGEALDHAI